MAPLNFALFNLREITKQMILLEGDLTTSQAYFCDECVKKRFLLIEALAEEAVHPPTKWAPLANELAVLTRRWQMAFSDGDNPLTIYEKVRKRRKALTDTVFRPCK
jgi:hypothetical protein